jgi:hypothetical protein
MGSGRGMADLLGIIVVQQLLSYLRYCSVPHLKLFKVQEPFCDIEIVCINKRYMI